MITLTEKLLVDLKLNQITFTGDKTFTVSDATNLGNTYPGAGKPKVILDPVFGRCMLFSGSERINLGDSHHFSKKSSFTLEVWVNPNLPAKSSAIILSTEESETQNPFLAFQAGSTTDYLIQTGQKYQVNSLEPLPNQEWTHLTVTYDGTHLKFYRNGILQDQMQASLLDWANDVGEIWLGATTQFQELHATGVTYPYMYHHDPNYTYAQFSPKGTYIWDHKVHGSGIVREALTGTEIHAFQKQRTQTGSETPLGMCFSPNEEYIVCSKVIAEIDRDLQKPTFTEIIQLIEANAKGKVIKEYHATHEGRQTPPLHIPCGFSRDGYLITGNLTLINVWNPDDLSQPLFNLPVNGIRITSTNMFGNEMRPIIYGDKLIILQDDDAIAIWNLRQGQEAPERTIEFKWEETFDAEFKLDPQKAWLSPDGKYYVLCNGLHDYITLDLMSGEIVLWGDDKKSRIPYLPAFKPDEKDVALLIVKGFATLYNIKTKQTLTDFKSPDRGVQFVQFSPNGRLFVTYNKFRGLEAVGYVYHYSAEVWDVQNSESPILTIKLSDKVYYPYFNFTADSNYLTIMGDPIQVWDISGHQRVPFTGKLANFKIYDGDLFADDSAQKPGDTNDKLRKHIEQSIRKTQVGTIFPLDFKLTNGEGQPALFTNTIHKETQTLKLAVQNVGRQNIILPSSKDNDGVFALRFRPGTLDNAGSVDISEADKGKWTIQHTLELDGSDLFYLRRTTVDNIAANTLIPQQTTTITLTNLKVLGSNVRSTRVQLRYRLHYKDGKLVEGSRLHYLDIVRMNPSQIRNQIDGMLDTLSTTAKQVDVEDLQGTLGSLTAEQVKKLQELVGDHSAIKVIKELLVAYQEEIEELQGKTGGGLTAVVIGPATILTGGKSLNNLTIRIINTSGKDVELAGANSSFIFDFHVNEPWGLATKKDLSSASITVLTDDSDWKKDTDKIQDSGKLKVIYKGTENKLKDGAFIEVQIKGFPCSMDPGSAYLAANFTSIGDTDGAATGRLTLTIERTPVMPLVPDDYKKMLAEGTLKPIPQHTIVDGALDLVNTPRLGFYAASFNEEDGISTPEAALTTSGVGDLILASQNDIRLIPDVGITGADDPSRTFEKSDKHARVWRNDQDNNQLTLAVQGDIEAEDEIRSQSITVENKIVAKNGVFYDVSGESQDHNPGHLVPRGGIIMWSGAVNKIPNGWWLCNGEKGTPDLRERFIVGAGGTSPSVVGSNNGYLPDDTGGLNNVSLKAVELPKHQHDINMSTWGDGAHQHTEIKSSGTVIRWGDEGGYSSGYIDAGDEQSGGSIYAETTGSAHSHRITGKTQDHNENQKVYGQGHENRPPYYALCFIMKL